MFWMGRPAQVSETRGANNQTDLLIKYLECLIIEKICEFRVFFYGTDITDVVKKMDVIFMEFR